MAAFRIHQSLVGKNALKIEQFWPIEKEDSKPIVKKVVTQEMWDKIVKKHGLKFKA